VSKKSKRQLGGLKAKKTVFERYGKDFYRRVGKLGGNPALMMRDTK
jgi:hypothetical protein